MPTAEESWGWMQPCRPLLLLLRCVCILFSSSHNAHSISSPNDQQKTDVIKVLPRKSGTHTSLRCLFHAIGYAALNICVKSKKTALVHKNNPTTCTIRLTSLCIRKGQTGYVRCFCTFYENPRANMCLKQQTLGQMFPVQSPSPLLSALYSTMINSPLFFPKFIAIKVCMAYQ